MCLVKAKRKKQRERERERSMRLWEERTSTLTIGTSNHDLEIFLELSTVGGSVC